ncbi:MAG: indolepyruvate ferredoxin oxidoreductase subunit alpha [Clostridiaceae bacterium]|nr:indolepyruvate ferredoxin oxidoreductase subunit alpha [Clostridiaceae bacterium]
MNKRLMLGNEAVARGLYEAGCRFISSYPGTPSTEITEEAAKYPEIYAEWAPNEKVAVEAAYGAAVYGARSFAAMKHVGLNVAADLVFSASYAGVNAGFVMAVADDPGMHSSQNEQDSRNYARASKIPMLEPSDSQECADYMAAAFELSEKFDTPVFVRTSTRIAHSQSVVVCKERRELPLKPYEKNPQKYVMAPANARARHPYVEDRSKRLAEFADTSELNQIIPAAPEHEGKIGVVCAGIAYQYAREALGESASYCKLGIVWPMPEHLLREFAASVKTLYVVEELDAFLETGLRAMGIPCIGKDVFPRVGEYTPAMIAEKILGTSAPETIEVPAVPARPPVLCPGCPHRGLFYVLHKMNLTVSGDIGCYTLGSAAPLNAMDTTLDMGASISMLHGRNVVRPDETDHAVAVIGDSTFMHSGMTGLVNAVYNHSASTIIIADNSITGMTGHQDNPTTGKTLKGDVTAAVNLEALCHAVGVTRVRVCDPYDVEELEQILREELAAKEVSVVIARRPCALLKTVKHGKPYTIDASKCKRCRMCMKIGCPAIRFSMGTGASIDESLCVGCDLCARMCKFGAIEGGASKC